MTLQTKFSDFLAQVHKIGISRLALGAFAVWCLYWVAVSIYRVYFHPLAKIPGPKLAALTFWYEFYYEIFPYKFQYLWKIKELHEQYGPIIRINPTHVHIHDAGYFDTIYAAGVNHKRNRDPRTHHISSNSSANPITAGSILETMDHDMHRMRRSAVAGFFSKRNIRGLEPVVMRSVHKLMGRFRGAVHEQGVEKGVVNLSYAYAAMTMDIIFEYCFGESMGYLNRAEYGKPLIDMLQNGEQPRVVARFFPGFFNFMMGLPAWLVVKLNPGIGELVLQRSMLLGRIERIMRYEEEKTSIPGGPERTIFHEIRDDVGATLSAEEKKPNRLVSEASVFVGAGTVSTARALAVTTFYLLKEVEVSEKLRKELKGVIKKKDQAVALPMLEALPYLSAVINEGLRCAHAVASPMPRIATQEDLSYHGYIIPRGTPVAESAYLLHTDPTFFPDPFTFRPERWFENPKLTRYMFPFGRGSRSCLDMNLATLELYFTIAMVWRWMRMEIWDTVEERDVLTTHALWITGISDLKSEGIKVKVVGEDEDEE